MNIFTMLWATFTLVFIVLEIGHPSLLFYLPLSLASFIAALAAYYEYLFINQLIVFFFSSALAIWLFKKFLKKMHGSSYRTNVDALMGKEAVVTAAIYVDAPGYVKVQGEYWLARSSHACLPIDSKARIVGVRGAHVIVEPYN
jgi:membrane protein implicated in regulation of membrane protease activity